jgi:hypothetical protein
MVSYSYAPSSKTKDIVMVIVVDACRKNGIVNDVDGTSMNTGTAYCTDRACVVKTCVKVEST